MKALLTSVPKGAMIVLDLDSTDREQYTRKSVIYPSDRERSQNFDTKINLLEIINS